MDVHGGSFLSIVLIPHDHAVFVVRWHTCAVQQSTM